MNCDVPVLWQEYKEALYFYILKRVHDENTAKDISQEVLLKVYNFCCCKTGVNNVRSWLFQIAQNSIIDYYRKTNKNILVSGIEDRIEEDESYAFKDAAEFILPMIQLLPEIYAVPLQMSEVEGFKLKDIALSLNLSLAAVKKRIVRGRKQLRDLFTECCLIELDGKGRLISFDIRPDCKSLQRYKRSLDNRGKF